MSASLDIICFLQVLFLPTFLNQPFLGKIPIGKLLRFSTLSKLRVSEMLNVKYVMDIGCDIYYEGFVRLFQNNDYKNVYFAGYDRNN